MRWMMAAAWRQVTLLALCMIAAAPVHAVEEEAHVLILNGLDPYLPAYIVIDGAMRASLANERTRRVVVFSESLDAQRFPQALEPEFPALLAKRYGALRIDVVVVVSQVALEFFKRHSELWPGARLVYVGFPGEAIGPLRFQPTRPVSWLMWTWQEPSISPCACSPMPTGSLWSLVRGTGINERSVWQDRCYL
jgi:hypothetical protein